MPAAPLRPDLLAGCTLAVAGPAEWLAAHGADVVRVALGAAGEGPVDTLVVDAGAARGSALAMREVVDGAWDTVRDVVNAAWVETEAPGGRVVLVAPAAVGGDAHAAAARAALENLARTLSTEWARLGIRVVAVLPGASTSAEEIGSLVAFLAGPGGEYYSGCAFTLGAVEARTA